MASHHLVRTLCVWELMKLITVVLKVNFKKKVYSMVKNFCGFAIYYFYFDIVPNVFICRLQAGQLSTQTLVVVYIITKCSFSKRCSVSFCFVFGFFFIKICNKFELDINVYNFLNSDLLNWKYFNLFLHFNWFAKNESFELYCT